ncbi:Ubiquitin carboxyl-terminal hydrolase family protein [Hibiscus syriacus]|uniref:Ubiquitin carboxyl-terminal hydrolase family protein n=1 Tax=Hibiscus syriacus TaxID=106335 RepID=A0A6A3B694_HIBSY|nr:Ubiquitin carboxyl-terminal hydrolase family protein [Hibiscus syriacus]
MEVSKNYGHQHPLVLLNEEQLITNPSGTILAECSMCGEKVSVPCFGCAEDCGFYLHKVCADAPLELNHPLHRNHPLVLLPNAPYRGMWVCHFCDKTGEKFVYHCSCGLDFHIRCALFTFHIDQNNLKELQHVALEPPMISTSIIVDEQLEDVRKCLGCREPLANFAYFSPHCGFNLHKKCAELPLILNHMCHRTHPLLLQFNSGRLPCKICQETRRRGFVYGCSPCKFAIHIECVSPSPIIEDKNHPHPFSLFLRQAPFICDACGTEGSHAAYGCGTCNIMVHKECISLPRIIKSRSHDHRVFHTYSLHKEYFGSLNCLICHDEVNTEYGSYYCADCNVIFHVKCATKYRVWYYVVSPENEDGKPLDVNSITNVLERNVAGEATLIEHFKHHHYLTLIDNNREYDDKCCDGCMLPVSDSFYYCSLCEFFLHKSCAELPKMKNIWLHYCQLAALVLTSDDIFECELCDWVSNGFAYKCNECGRRMCLRCATLTPDSLACPGHQHPLLFYLDEEGKCNACGENNKCNACGENSNPIYCCKDCKYSVDLRCTRLPEIVRHKCDDHLLALTYHEVNDYSKHHRCDICEQKTDPKVWFYHCATCDTSAHLT